MWDPRKDAWLAGFADGEASFNLVVVGPQGRRRIQPRFDMHLRPDDAPVLRLLREAFGGSNRLYHHGGYDRFLWCVASKADLLGLVAYFDRFPLRAKKARDYAIWREGALLYCRARSTSAILPEMEGLKAALIEGRRYDREATVTQLRSVG